MNATMKSCGDSLATGRALRLVVHALEGLGVEPDALLAQANLPSTLVDEPDMRIPHGQSQRIWHAARKLTGDDAVGLHAGACVDVGDLDVLGYLAGSCATGREALERVTRYAALLHEGIELSLESGKRSQLTWHYRPGTTVGRSSREFTAAMLLRTAKTLSGATAPPIELRFTHAAPPYADEYRRVFGAPVRFGAKKNAIVMEPRRLEGPMPKADPRLSQILERHARDLLSKLPEDHGLSARVRTELARTLADGPPRANATAAALGLSPRSLRRQLRAEGTHFREILDQVRAELALRFLRDERLGVEATAERLGFSDASALRKAMLRIGVEA